MFIQGHGRLAGGGGAGGGGEDLRQRGQALKGLRPLRPKACGPVRQLLHPVLHADGQLFPAHGADAAKSRRLRRGQAHSAVPVAVQVVLPLLREELDGAGKPRSGADGLHQLRVVQAGVQDVCLPAQLGGGVGVGVGHQGEAVQGGDPPVHGRVGGQARLHRVDVTGQVGEARLHGVEAGEGAEQGEVGRPDVGGDELRVRTRVQGQLQQIPAVQPQDGPPVGADVADGLQFGGQLVRRLQGGEEDQVVDLPGPPVPFVDAADLTGDEEPGSDSGGGVRQAQIVPQSVEPLLGGEELLPELRPPGGMGEVPGAHQGDALPPGPPVQMGQVPVAAGGPGEAGVDVEIGDIHGSHPLRKMSSPL